jgi:hypothetical protein
MPVCLVDFLSVNGELHGHVLYIATHWWVIGFSAVTLIAYFLYAHKRA